MIFEEFRRAGRAKSASGNAATELCCKDAPGRFNLDSVLHQQHAKLTFSHQRRRSGTKIGTGNHLEAAVAASIFREAGFRLHKASHRRHPKLPAFAGELLDGALLKPS